MKIQRKKALINSVKAVVPLVIGGGLMWYFYTSMDATTKKIFYNAIENANYFWIILSMVLGFVSHLLRASRWKYMLEPLGCKTKFWHRYHSLMIGYLVNLLVPRAGEISRGGMLYQTDKIPFSKSFGTIIAERVIDVIMLGLIFIVAISLSLDDLIAVKNIIASGEASGGGEVTLMLEVLLSVLGGMSVLFVILWATIDAFRVKVKGFIKELVGGVFSILKSKQPGQFLLHTFLIWILYVVFFAICFQAFHITTHFPIDGILVAFIAGTIGLMFTNGGIGAYPYLVGIVVVYFLGRENKYDYETLEGVGKALGMVIWLSQTVMIIILGLISLILLPKNYKRKGNEQMGES